MVHDVEEFLKISQLFSALSLFGLAHLLLQEKLFASKNRTEASLGKKLKNDMLPEIEKVHKVLKIAFIVI